MPCPFDFIGKMVLSWVMQHGIDGVIYDYLLLVSVSSQDEEGEMLYGCLHLDVVYVDGQGEGDEALSGCLDLVEEDEAESGCLGQGVADQAVFGCHGQSEEDVTVSG